MQEIDYSFTLREGHRPRASSIGGQHRQAGAQAYATNKLMWASAPFHGTVYQNWVVLNNETTSIGPESRAAIRRSLKPCDHEAVGRFSEMRGMPQAEAAMLDCR
jgi:hypothetical protein